MKSFSLTETIFHSPKCKKYAFAGFLKFDTVPACAKTEVGRRFDVNISCASLHNDFVELDKIQVNKPANNFCRWAGHLSGQRPVLTRQEASLVGQKCKSV